MYKVPLEKDKKEAVINAYQMHERDTGSAEVQVALMTERINGLTEHFKSFRKDHHSRRGLLRLVGQRRKLLKYIQEKDEDRYRALLGRLGLRK